MDAGTDAVTALEALRDVVAGADLDLQLEGVAGERADRDALVQQIDDYLLPRLRELDAPLLAVVGGSTGAGKSTLVNSLLGEEVSPAGVLRPTTRAPVLVCHPADRHRFEGDRVLPRLARTTGEAPGQAGTVHLVTSASLPPGLALLDAPDIDSVVSSNRALAAQLLAAADLWIFVTTAARYADAVPWDLLAEAGRRSAAVAVVLDRVPAQAVAEIEPDLHRMLAEHGVRTALVHSIRESELEGGLLPDAEVAPLRSWLVELGDDAAARAGVIRTTLQGALDDLDRRIALLADAVAAQREVADRLGDHVDVAYAEACDEIDAAVRSGTLLRGEVLDRWQEVVGTGELMRSVQARVSAARDRVWAAVTGRRPAAVGMQEAVESGVASLVQDGADRAAGAVVERWRGEPAGRALLDGREQDLGRASAVLLERLPDEVRAWQGAVLDLVREEGAEKRTSARIASFTLNGAGLAVMLAVFAQTAGLTGAELVIAGGTSAASQKLLEALFGDQAVRTLAKLARDDLLERVDRLLADDAARFRDLLDAAAPAPAADIDAVQRRWRDARRAGALQ
jgi:hypothetical protein